MAKSPTWVSKLGILAEIRRFVFFCVWKASIDITTTERRHYSKRYLVMCCLTVLLRQCNYSESYHKVVPCYVLKHSSSCKIVPLFPAHIYIYIYTVRTVHTSIHKLVTNTGQYFLEHSHSYTIKITQRIIWLS